jgi:putative iron-regulated protein
LGPSLSALVAEAEPAVDAALRAALDTSTARLGRIKTAAEAGYSYDRMLERGNAHGEALVVRSVDALVSQTRDIERAVSAIGLDPERT